MTVIAASPDVRIVTSLLPSLSFCSQVFLFCVFIFFGGGVLPDALTIGFFLGYDTCSILDLLTRYGGFFWQLGLWDRRRKTMICWCLLKISTKVWNRWKVGPSLACPNT
jgi:hypothetical protein